MEPALASKFPEIRTFRGVACDDPTTTVRFDLTPLGFHAMVFSSHSTWFIDPYQRGDTDHYVSYFKHDFRLPAGARPFECLVEPSRAKPRPVKRTAAVGTELRTYRAAVAATGEYTAFHGGVVASGMAAITTVMNRVNGIYEREFAVLLVLVANNDLLVYTDPDSDPYTNNNASAMLNENQSNIDAVIGDANYDIGHALSTGNGGRAYIGVPCNGGQKARGVSGQPSPTGHPFYVDYVAHEIGHQFGGEHSFNGTTSSCGGNRVAGSAYEPGSGSTIMGYAGICEAEDLQEHSDDYFHAVSFDEIVAYTTTGWGNTCATISATGNSPPTVDAGDSYTIPAQTPFTLTGSADDPDDDPLVYGWEQFDLGDAAPPNTDNGNRPIFRSFLPVATPSRTFPSLADILANTSTLGESLPTTTRTLTFRLTARDLRVGGGGVDHDTVTLSVDGSAGPFVVTNPNTAMTWRNNTEYVRWDVAATDQSPVACSEVEIRLSLDSGQTFPHLLATTANNGSATVSPLAYQTTTARIKVLCSTNIFFDISDADFTIIDDSDMIFADGFESADTSRWSS